MEKTINIGGRLHNPAVGGSVAGADEIKDDTKGKMQNVINQETDAELVRLDEAKQEKLTFDQIPTEGSTNPVTSGGVHAADAALQQAIEAILLLIPSAASALNQLADKSFVNSSISTATATFRGTYNLVTDLELTVSATHQQIATTLASVVSTADNNDYCFVQIPVSDQSTDIRVTERYKFNGTSWSYEYDLNNSGFTADQWAAINSGITSVLVSKLGALPTAAELAVMFAGKQNTLTFDSTPVAGSDNPVKSSGLYNAFAVINAMIPEGADANNKLVAESRLVAYVTTLINALDATFDVTSADGHVTLRMTQADGVITSVQILTSDIASDAALTTLGGRVSTAEADIDALQEAYAALTQSDVVIVEGALPSSGQQQNIIYRQPDQDHTPPQFYSDYMWNGTTWVLMATYMNAIDPRPKKGSQNLVTSGGVFDNMGALDVSELNATENPHTLATYADLSAALAAIPSDYQKGGMSFKFVLTSDNKYVQFRCIADAFTTDVNYWSVECENIIVDDPEFIVVALDADKKLLVGIRKADGKVWYGAGVPPQVVDYIEKVVANLHIENKVDKETGKSLIDAVFAATQSFTNDPEYLRVATDNEKRFLAGFKREDGKLDLPTQKIPDLITDEKSLSVEEDKEGKVINETFKDGSVAHYTDHTFMKELSLKKGLILPDGTVIDGLHNNSIERLYDKYDFEAILNNITRTPITNDGGGNVHASYQRVCFLHYSDIHKAVANNERIMKFYRLYRRYITDVVLTGDIAEGNYTDYDDNFEVDNDYKNVVLKVIGNHDVYYPSQPGKICTPQAAYEKFFKGIANWGVNYTANKCYYYKDYPNANLRLIVIDIMRLISPWNWGYSTDDQEQLDWLTDTLESARESGYSVIISAHWVPAIVETTERLDTSFDDKDISAVFENHGSNELLSIVDTFINNGGEFVCWMVGHRHADLVGTTKAEGSGNKQLYVVVECAISRDNWSNYYRGSGTKAFDCFNLMSVDTHAKIISIYRIGAEFNNLLQHKVSISIDYENKDLIK